MWFFRSPLVAFGEDALSHLEQVKGKRACRAQMDTGMVMSRRIPDIAEIRRLLEAAYTGTHVDF
jgi:hypothetical protein